MPVQAYRYRAARPDGVLEKGRITSANQDDARSELNARGLLPLELVPERAFGLIGKRLDAAELALGLRMLATLLESGLPLSRALGALSTVAPGRWKAALPEVRDSVKQGRSLAAALGAAPLGCPPVVTGIIRAGEAGSGLAGAVKRASELMEEVAASRAALIGALTYPALLAIAGTSLLLLLAAVVLPRFAAILSDLGQSLPTSTKLVLATADVTRAAIIPGVLAIVTVGVALRVWTDNQSGKVRWHALLLRLPVVGTIRFAAATGRACTALAALLESGVPLAQALLHGGVAAGDAALHERMRNARERVIAGQRLSSSFDAVSAVSPTALHLIRAGEEAGRLAEMLRHAARLEAERATDLLRKAIRLVEPAMILFFGGLVALAAAALLQAMYAVRPS